jgi:VRR-NUC domain
MSEQLATREWDRLSELETVIERGLETFIEVGQALMEIRDGRLYRAEHGTFEGYCQERWGFTDRRARQLIDAAQIGTMVPLSNERQARELVPLLDQPGQLREVVAEVGEQPTAAKVRSAVEKRTGPYADDRISEQDFQQTVTDALTAFGWRWIHFRPARTERGWRTALSGSPGYPDITAVRGDRILFIEMKAQNGKLRDEQRGWLSALGAAGAEVHCWRPDEWALIEELIR